MIKRSSLVKKLFIRKYPYIKWIANRKKIEFELKKEIQNQNAKIEKLCANLITLEKKQAQKTNKEINVLSDRVLNLESKNKFLEKKLQNDALDKLNKKLSSGEYNNIVLTTYPEFTTGNVGDAMITDSFVKLLQVHVENFKFLRVFRGQALDDLELEHIKNIFAPGFSVAPGTYPKNYKLFDKIEKIEDYNFFPFGCSYQHYLPEDASFSLDNYEQEDIDLLKKLSRSSGALPCRDEMINNMMNKAGVQSYYCGDLVLFDPEVIGRSYTGCKNVKSIAFSVQHKAKYINQSIELLTLVREHFPEDVKIYLTLHGVESSITQKLQSVAKTLNIETVSLYGESQNLSFYDNIDLHIGYRLHGHISFLRRRKPSILLVEDARSYGFSKTSGTGFGCFNAMNGAVVSKTIPKTVIDFIKNQTNNDFNEYCKVFNFIDKTYYETILPKFQSIAETLNKK